MAILIPRNKKETNNKNDIENKEDTKKTFQKIFLLIERNEDPTRLRNLQGNEEKV